METPEDRDQARLLRFYRSNPAQWARDHLDIEMTRYRREGELVRWLEQQPSDTHQWCRRQLLTGKLTLDASRSYQAEMLDRMATPGWYAFQTANGVAKTVTAALVILWFLDVFHESRALTTAGTWSQLQEQLWREIPIWANRATQPITTYNRIARTQINLGPDWAAFGRGADKAATFEGVHARNLMVVVDEAKAVDSTILEDAIRRILRSSDHSRLWFLVLSSPGSPTGTFYDICQGRTSHRFTVFRLSAYESERISLDQIAEDAVDLGEDSPLFIAMDIGEFPEEGEDTVIPISWAQANVGRMVEGDEAVLGVDVARFGQDETALVSLFGRRAEISAVYQGKDTTWTTGKIQKLNEQHEYVRIGIDDSGIGGAVTDQCRASHLKVQPVNFGSTDTRHPDRYVNVKAEMYFALRAELEAGWREATNPDVGLSLPDDRKLLHQLTCQRYLFDSRQRFKIESHAELAKRGERSPDRADSLAIANYIRRRDFQPLSRLIQINTVEARHRGFGATALNEKW